MRTAAVFSPPGDGEGTVPPRNCPLHWQAQDAFSPEMRRDCSPKELSRAAPRNCPLGIRKGLSLTLVSRGPSAKKVSQSGDSSRLVLRSDPSSAVALLRRVEAPLSSSPCVAGFAEQYRRSRPRGRQTSTGRMGDRRRRKGPYGNAQDIEKMAPPAPANRGIISHVSICSRCGTPSRLTEGRCAN